MTYEGQLLNFQIISCPFSSLALSTKLWTEWHYAILINYNKKLSNRNSSSVLQFGAKKTCIVLLWLSHFQNQTQIIEGCMFKKYRHLFNPVLRSVKWLLWNLCVGKMEWQRHSGVDWKKVLKKLKTRCSEFLSNLKKV